MRWKRGPGMSARRALAAGWEWGEAVVCAVVGAGEARGGDSPARSESWGQSWILVPQMRWMRS